MLDEALKDRKKDIYRALSIVLSSIFFANIPLLLFLIYMGYHGFFSYDFFSEGVFGLKVFFFLTSIFVLIISVAFFWWVVPLVKAWKKKKFKWFGFIITFIVNLLMAILFLMIPENVDVFRVGFVCTIGLPISVHIAFLLHAEPNEQLKSLIFAIFIITYVSLNFREQASSVLSSGLKTFGVGGNIEVVLEPKILVDNEIRGRLILLSPKHIYIKLGDSDNVSTINRSRFDVMTTKHNEDATKNASPVS